MVTCLSFCICPERRMNNEKCADFSVACFLHFSNCRERAVHLFFVMMWGGGSFGRKGVTVTLQQHSNIQNIPLRRARCHCGMRGSSSLINRSVKRREATFEDLLNSFPHAHAPQMPTTLEDLPGPAHATMASMLPDGNRKVNRRRTGVGFPRYAWLPKRYADTSVGALAQ